MREKGFKGFTLIELLVVIAIIGFLSGIVWTTLRGTMERARVAKVQQEIDSVAKALFTYRLDKGELPPLGEACSACTDPCDNTWLLVMDELMVGGYLQKRIDRDAWGNFLCYDDNDNVCCGGCTPLYSMGPNRTNDTRFNCLSDQGCPQTICNDDIGQVLPYGDRPNPW